MEKKTHGAITSVDMRNAEAMSDFVQDERSGMVTLEIYRKFYQGKRIEENNESMEKWHKANMSQGRKKKPNFHHDLSLSLSLSLSLYLNTQTVLFILYQIKSKKSCFENYLTFLTHHYLPPTYSLCTSCFLEYTNMGASRVVCCERWSCSCLINGTD